MARRQAVGAVCTSHILGEKTVEQPLIGPPRIWPDAVRQLRSDILQPRRRVRVRYKRLALYAIAITIAILSLYTNLPTNGMGEWTGGVRHDPAAAARA